MITYKKTPSLRVVYTKTLYLFELNQISNYKI